MFAASLHTTRYPGFCRLSLLQIRHTHNIMHQIQPETLLRRRPLRWRTVALLVACSSSATMALYLGIQTYKVMRSPLQTTQPQKVLLPLWVGFNWPSQRRLPVPKYLEYIESDASVVFGKDTDFDSFRAANVEGQVLDALFRLDAVRNMFGVPMSLFTLQSDDFHVWLEPKYPTVHGPQFRIRKLDGRLSVAWRWAITLVHWPEFSPELQVYGSNAQKKISEKSSGRVHVADAEKSDPPTDDFSVVFRGSYHIADTNGTAVGCVLFAGHIDPTHLALNGGVKITNLDLKIHESGEKVLYKIM